MKKMMKGDMSAGRMMAACVLSNFNDDMSLKRGMTRAIWGIIKESMKTENTFSRAFDLYFSKPKAARELTSTPKMTVRVAILSEFRK
jgi:hypothetical protein